MSPFSSTSRRRLAATLALLGAIVLLSAGATVASGAGADDGPTLSASSGTGITLSTDVATGTSTGTSTGTATSTATTARAGLPSLVETQLREQRSAQLQSMFQSMLQSQPTAPVTAETDPRIDQATCGLLGRSWTTAGCSRQTCVAGHEYAKTGANAETCRIGGRRGASYGVEVDFRRCSALHRVWIGLLNYCASDPHREQAVVPDAPQCTAPYTTYVVLSETPGSYDECLRPQLVRQLDELARATGQSLATVAAERSQTQCGWRPGRVWLAGRCQSGTAAGGDGPATVLVVGDSITWRGTNELATLQPDWVIDGSSGRQIDQLPERLAVFRASHGEPSGVVLALGTNGRSGYTEAQFRASVAEVPAGTPLLLVTPYREEGGAGRPAMMTEYAGWMQRLAADRPLTCVADWRAAASADQRLLVDGVHPTSIGEVYWAELVDSSWNSCLRADGLAVS